MTSTRNIWLASYFLAHGLVFARATRLAGPAVRCNFFFDDPRAEAPALTRRFLDDTAVQTLINARRALGGVIEVVRDRGLCLAEDIPDVLALVGVPWAKR